MPCKLSQAALRDHAFQRRVPSRRRTGPRTRIQWFEGLELALPVPGLRECPGCLADRMALVADRSRAPRSRLRMRPHHRRERARPSIPVRRFSRTPPSFAAITGSPDAIASSTTSPQVSGRVTEKQRGRHWRRGRRVRIGPGIPGGSKREGVTHVGGTGSVPAGHQKAEARHPCNHPSWLGNTRSACPRPFPPPVGSRAALPPTRCAAPMASRRAPERRWARKQRAVHILAPTPRPGTGPARPARPSLPHWGSRVDRGSAVKTCAGKRRPPVATAQRPRYLAAA